jgi:hypothetical protein
MDQPAPTRKPSSHRIATTLLVVLGTLATFLAISALWINRQVMDTDNWTDASSQMLEDPAIRTAVSGYLVDQLYTNVDVAGEIRAALPPRAAPLAAPAAGAVRNLAEDVTNRLLQRPRVQELWATANRTAHGQFLQIVKGGGPAVSTQNGVVTLDVGALLQQLEERIGVGGKLASKVGGNARIEVMRSDQLSFAQDVANVLRPLAIVLILLMLALYGGAIALARGRRRETLRAVGFGFIVAGTLALLLRSAGQDAVANSLATTDAVRPAIDSVWRIGTSLLSEAATAAIGYGVVIVFAAWLAGPTRAAVGTRRALAPFLRDPVYAWGGATFLVILVLLWGPTPGTRHLVPALILIGLFALGVEALRRETAREFPGATRPEFGEVVRNAVGRLGSGSRHARSGNGRRTSNGEAVPVTEADRLAQLERLADLHDRGALSDSEFADQKTELLAAH